jgi:EmrB/QacA subfamily drug resistance transporter
MTTEDATSTPKTGIAQGHGILVLALMMAVSLAALEGTVVVTAAPTIAGSLGGLSLFSWVFSIYLLASTVTVPIYGKLADLYGRKPVLVTGVVAFLAGSILCGIATSMEMLIVFRAVQGLGAGAVLPITITIIGDTFSIQERAKIQGFFSGVWGVAGIAGPAIGGLITDYVSWRWVFFINLPFGIACLVLLLRFYAERTEKRLHVLDYPGALLLSGAIVSLLLALLHGGETYGWLSLETLALFGVAVLSLALFIVQELKAPEPMIPLSLFRIRAIAVSSFAVFLAGALMFGVSSYIPLFAKGVFGSTATEAGFVLAPMSICWVVGAIVCGRIILRTGFYPSAVVGGVSLVLGAVVLLFLRQDNSIFIAVAAGAFMGIGMGFTTNSTTIAVQNSVDWGQRGVVTASIQFFRTIGGAVGVAVMGALLNSRFASRLEEAGVAEGQRAEALLDQTEREALPVSVLEAMESALATSLQEVFLIVFGAAALCFAALLFFPRGAVTEAARPVSRPVASASHDS